ncbi:MAG: regulatory iron-sulfur-containing complex subunit RicT [Bacteroidota bacterium]
MGCGSCGSGGCSPAGCGQNGGCSTGGCNKLNTYDWLGNMLRPDQTEVDNVYEVRFKNTHKGFFRNVNGLRLYIGDRVVVESDRGYDVGILSLGGIAAELQMKRKGVKGSRNKLLRIYRKANQEDLELQVKARSREQETLIRTREIVLELKLDMKISDVEFQADNAKAIFYYIADHRVDFRELIKILAREFRIRVEMRQIGLRHEAGLVGGIGSCGRELCCSTWLTEFKTVSTAAARYQNLSLNPMKISGLCGRLKCCLNFELDSYLDAVKDIPKVDRIETKKGRAFLQKTDIFKRKMWFSYQGETTWYPMDVDEVARIIELNNKGEKPEIFSSTGTLLSEESAKVASLEESLDFVDVVGTNIPEPEKRNKRRGKRGGRNQGNGNNRKQANNRKQGGRNRSNNQNKENGGGDGDGKPQNKSNNRGKGRNQRRSNQNKQGGNSSQNGPNNQKGNANQGSGRKNRKPRRSPKRPSTDSPPKS